MKKAETDAAPSIDPRLRRRQARVFAVCWLAYFLTYFGRTNLSVAISALESRFASGKTAVGLLGTLFFWVYAIGKLLNGYSGDRADNRWQVFWGLAVSGLCNVGVAFAGQLWIVMVLWGLNGFAQSALWCNIISLVSHWFYPHQHAGTAVWLNTSMVGGALAGWGVCGWLVQNLPYQWVFLLPGLVLTGFAVCWLLLVQNSAAEAGFADENICAPVTLHASRAPDSRALRAFWCTAGLTPVMLASLAQGVVKDGIGLWGPEMVSSVYNLTPGADSFLLLFIPFMNFIGIALAGRFQSRLHLSDTAASLALMAAATACIGGLQFSMGRSLAGGVFWLGMASAVMYGVNTIMLGIFPMRFTSCGRVSFVSGLLDFVSYLAAGAASVFSGWVLDNNMGWHAVFTAWQALTLTGMLALLWILRRERSHASGGAAP